MGKNTRLGIVITSVLVNWVMSSVYPPTSSWILYKLLYLQTNSQLNPPCIAILSKENLLPWWWLPKVFYNSSTISMETEQQELCWGLLLHPGIGTPKPHSIITFTNSTLCSAQLEVLYSTAFPSARLAMQSCPWLPIQPNHIVASPVLH